MTETGPASTIAFLRQPSSYPDRPRSVRVVETHMSWVFLTDAHAYKLKKPVRNTVLDFSSVALRQRNCEEEVRLNRRLAPDVYLGVVALTAEADGALALGGRGQAVDWLVRMHRLAARDMLEAVIAEGRAGAEEGSVRAAARHLATFYLEARPEPISAAAHCALLVDGCRGDLRELSRARYGLPREKVTALAEAQLRFLATCAAVFERRVNADHIVDGHGDLRPEHICLHPVPAIIDCLEFAKELRILDPADELAFLSLECERLGEPRVGRWFLDTYTHVTGDEPAPSLLHFYRVYRALRRATIAARHLDDPSVPDPERFAALARHYIELVEPVVIEA